MNLWSWGLIGLSAYLVSCTTSKAPNPAAAGTATWNRETYSETGQLIHRDTLTVQQNENPESPTRIRIPDQLDIELGQSWLQSIPKSYEGMERTLMISGIVLIVLGGFLGGIGQHWKLMTIALLTGTAFIAIAVTIEEYAWAYGLGLLILAILLGSFLWARYKTKTIATLKTQIQGLEGMEGIPA